MSLSVDYSRTIVVHKWILSAYRRDPRVPGGIWRALRTARRAVEMSSADRSSAGLEIGCFIAMGGDPGRCRWRCRGHSTMPPCGWRLFRACGARRQCRLCFATRCGSSVLVPPRPRGPEGPVLLSSSAVDSACCGWRSLPLGARRPVRVRRPLIQLSEQHAGRPGRSCDPSALVTALRRPVGFTRFVPTCRVHH